MLALFIWAGATQTLRIAALQEKVPSLRLADLVRPTLQVDQDLSVAEAVRLVRESGLPNETNAMFTNVEGEWDEVMALLKACVDKVAESAPRVSVVVKIDHRPGVTDGLTAKVAAVEAHLA